MAAFEIPQDLDAELSGNFPSKCVKTPADMQFWMNCKAYKDIIGFINGISDAVQGKRINDDIYVSEQMQKLIDIFDNLNKIVDEVVPIDQPQRFGNKAFRAFTRRKNNDIFKMITEIFPEDKCNHISEIGFYLSESFGNAVRIDYGTGHELSFIFFMCSLFKAEILTEEDATACGLRLFNEYLKLVRRLQIRYRMEPAGSHGVWSLDDFQFVPFIWGSAQLATNSPFDPAAFMDDAIINEYKDEYMFIGCIDYIRQVKTGHFAEHSNQLWSISAVPSWSKINSGLVKMYTKEVLSKFPIIQHVSFGKLLSFESAQAYTTEFTSKIGKMGPPKPVAPSTSSSISSKDTKRTIDMCEQGEGDKESVDLSIEAKIESKDDASETANAMEPKKSRESKIQNNAASEANQ